jgi:hypothetical protein
MLLSRRPRRPFSRIGATAALPHGLATGRYLTPWRPAWPPLAFERGAASVAFDIHLGDPGVVDEAILKRGSFGHSRMPGTRAVYG